MEAGRKTESQIREEVRAQAWRDAERDIIEAQEEAEFEANREFDPRPFGKVSDVPRFDDVQRDLFRDLAADARRRRAA